MTQEGKFEHPEKDSMPQSEVITGVPAELDGEQVRAEVEAQHLADLAGMEQRDRTETSLTAATVTSQFPPQPPTPPQNP